MNLRLQIFSRVSFERVQVYSRLYFQINTFITNVYPVDAINAAVAKLPFYEGHAWTISRSHGIGGIQVMWGANTIRSFDAARALAGWL